MIAQPHPVFGWLLVALLAAMFAALGFLALRPDPDCPPARVKAETGFGMPAFAMEFAEDYGGVAALYRACKPESLRKSLDADDRFVIPFYASLLPLVLALIFLCTPGWTPLPLRLAALALGVCLVGAAAFFDARENNTLRAIIGKTTGSETTGATLATLPRERIDEAGLGRDLRDLRRATNAKWSLIFAWFAVAGLMVLSRGGWWSAAVAAACLALAGLGLACVFANWHSLLEFTFTRLLPVPLLLIGLWLALPPRADEAAPKIAAGRAARAATESAGKTP